MEEGWLPWLEVEEVEGGYPGWRWRKWRRVTLGGGAEEAGRAVGAWGAA